MLVILSDTKGFQQTVDVFMLLWVFFLTEKILILTIEETMTHEVLLHNKT